LSIVAAFDNNPHKVGRVIHGCRCYSLDELPEVVRQLNIQVGVLTVPAGEAQAVADMLVRSGVKGILNFAPVPLKAPPNVYVEDIDMTMSLEKVAFFAGKGAVEKGTVKEIIQ
jgi:redox-sensing transcriptional repressor